MTTLVVRDIDYPVDGIVIVGVYSELLSREQLYAYHNVLIDFLFQGKQSVDSLIEGAVYKLGENHDEENEAIKFLKALDNETLEQRAGFDMPHIPMIEIREVTEQVKSIYRNLLDLTGIRKPSDRHWKVDPRNTLHLNPKVARKVRRWTFTEGEFHDTTESLDDAEFRDE